ncbi:MAG: ECF transporter S component [Clostridia bacterium]|nr:ECF transporter S component [Clostridia bacterium]
MENSKKFFTTKNIVYLAVLSALLVVLNLLSSVFKIITSVNLTLVPIVIGALLLGLKGGAILGFISGLMTFIIGVTGADAFTHILFIDHPVLTFLTCTVKTTCAGALAGFVYSLFENKKKYLGTFVSSALAPIINTGLFILGALLMSDTLKANFVADGQTVMYFLIIVCAGVNFLIELAVNMVLAPAVFKVVDVINNRISRG